MNRFSMIVGFLDEESKSGSSFVLGAPFPFPFPWPNSLTIVLRDLFVKVKHRIAELESSWEV